MVKQTRKEKYQKFYDAYFEKQKKDLEERWKGREKPTGMAQRVLDANLHYWHPDDKDWMKQRKILWKDVFKNIKVLKPYLRLDKEDYYLLKTLFFTGKLDYVRAGKSSMDFDIIFFYFWFFPDEPTIEILQPLIDTPMGLSYPKGSFWLNIADFPPPYGFMGGREILYYEVFFPANYWKETKTVACNFYDVTGNHKAEEALIGVRPKNLLFMCFTIKRLMTDENSNPYNPGQCLWDKFDYNYVHHLDEFEVGTVMQIPCIKSNPVSWLLVSVINVIQGFYELDDTLKNCSIAIDIREKLYQRFESNEFSPRLQQVWEDIKESRAKVKPTSKFDWNDELTWSSQKI